MQLQIHCTHISLIRGTGTVFTFNFTFTISDMLLSYRRAVLKICFADPFFANPKITATSSQGIRGYIHVMAAFKFAYFLVEGLLFC